MHERTDVFEYIGMFYNPWCELANKGMTPRLSCKFSGKVTSVIRTGKQPVRSTDGAFCLIGMVYVGSALV
ncbi:hypothetical protein [Thalassospira sp.]|uniref:hypothetical protein n=1 Tax=Thalassospira sp. TaxID=1912094 RepID=UPI003AA8F4A6